MVKHSLHLRRDIVVVVSDTEHTECVIEIV